MGSSLCLCDLPSAAYRPLNPFRLQAVQTEPEPEAHEMSWSTDTLLQEAGGSEAGQKPWAMSCPKPGLTVPGSEAVPV